jgi:exodeoxyribonuclease VIII
MDLGAAFHCAILEPDEYNNRLSVLPKGFKKVGKDNAALYDAIIDAGLTPITNSDHESVMAMAKAMRANKLTQTLFAIPHTAEQSIFAEVNGVKCKCRPDFLIMPDMEPLYPDGLIVDMKSAKDASPDGFGKQAWDLGYHLQAAFYRMVFYTKFKRLPRFIFGAVESKYPHLTKYHEDPDDLGEYAAEIVTEALQLYRQCLTTGIWPGYGEGIEPTRSPGWARRLIENPEESMELSYV